MKSQAAQSQSIGRRSNQFPLWNNLQAQAITNMGQKTLDDFFRGVFSGIGLEISGVYKIQDLIKIFDARGTSINAIKGIEYPGDINTEIKAITERSNFTKDLIKNLMFDEKEDKDNFDDILEVLDQEFRVDRVSILPSFTQFNQSVSVKERYFVVVYGTMTDGSEVDVPVISVEIS